MGRFVDRSAYKRTGEKGEGEHWALYELLCRFREGYRKKATAEADAFVEELFVLGDCTCVLGTGTGELFLGSDQVKSIIREDGSIGELWISIVKMHGLT
jgi:hypothetical protein